MNTNFDHTEAARQRQADLDFARSELPTWAFVVMVVLFGLFGISVLLFTEACKLWGEMRTKAVGYGYATHDAKTGEWQWIVPPPKPGTPP